MATKKRSMESIGVVEWIDNICCIRLNEGVKIEENVVLYTTSPIKARNDALREVATLCKQKSLRLTNYGAQIACNELSTEIHRLKR